MSVKKNTRKKTCRKMFTCEHHRIAELAPRRHKTVVENFDTRKKRLKFPLNQKPLSDIPTL